MIDQLKQYEKTLQKFKEWIMEDSTHSYYFEDDVMFNDSPVWRPLEWGRDDRELLSLLVEFCDSKGYYIQIKVYYDRDSLAGMYYDIDQVHIDRYIIRDEKGSITRTEATKAAIVRVFQLMEAE